jgi:hypothetical protein
MVAGLYTKNPDNLFIVRARKHFFFAIWICMGHKLQVQTGGSAPGGTGNYGEAPDHLEFLF